MEIATVQTRSLILTPEATDNNGEMTFSFSSETPVDRGWGREILRHDSGCADFSRMGTAPFLWNHDRNAVLGVLKKAWISGKRGHCTIKWSSEAEAQKYKRQVDEGILSNVSFAYSIDEIKEVPTMGSKTSDFHVNRWTPLEVSLVSVPADHTVGIGRAYESTMIVINEHKDNRYMEENLDNMQIQLTSKQCRYEFGDSKCGVNLTPYTQTFTVTGIDTNRKFYLDGAITNGDAGTITFTSGANEGLSQKIASADGGGTVILFEPMPFVIEAGDEVTIVAGCVKTREQCMNYNNVINFGGEPDVPGVDEYLKGA